ncbi:hypothetical protein KAU33_14600, partial [Candidatus Dependentiae bacterium]|nr:hypothetical protein [Candidatus Dependentiae bacterium]
FDLLFRAALSFELLTKFYFHVKILKKKGRVMKKLLGIDIDGVIANSDVKFRESMTKYFNKDFNREDVFTFSYEESFGITKEEMRGFWNHFYKKGEWLTIEPLKGAIESIQKLKKFYTIFVVTGRPDGLKEVTEGWLKKYNVYYDELFMTNFLDKFEHLLNNGHRPEWFIEDHLYFSIGLARNGVKVLLFDYPWNRTGEDVTHINIYRVNGWADALEHLLEGKK